MLRWEWAFEHVGMRVRGEGVGVGCEHAPWLSAVFGTGPVALQVSCEVLNAQVLELDQVLQTVHLNLQDLRGERGGSTEHLRISRQVAWVNPEALLAN